MTLEAELRDSLHRYSASREPAAGSLEAIEGRLKIESKSRGPAAIVALAAALMVALLAVGALDRGDTGSELRMGQVGSGDPPRLLSAAELETLRQDRGFGLPEGQYFEIYKTEAVQVFVVVVNGKPRFVGPGARGSGIVEFTDLNQGINLVVESDHAFGDLSYGVVDPTVATVRIGGAAATTHILPGADYAVWAVNARVRDGEEIELLDASGRGLTFPAQPSSGGAAVPHSGPPD